MGYDDLYNRDFALCRIQFTSPTKEYFQLDIDGVQWGWTQVLDITPIEK